MPAWKTRVHRGDLTPFWPLTNANSIVVMVGEQENKHSSIPFNYKKSDFNVLKFDTGSEVSNLEKEPFYHTRVMQIIQRQLSDLHVLKNM